MGGEDVLPLVEGGKGIGVSTGVSSGHWAATGGAGTFSAVNADFYDADGNPDPQDYAGRMPEFLAHVAPLVREGKLKTREHVIFGLENAPAGLVGVLRGENFGKAVVKVA